MFITICLFVCLSVCLSDVCLWTKFQPNWCTDLDAVFAYVPYRTGSDPIEIDDIDSKVKVTMTENACLNDEYKIAKDSNVNIFKI